jgi:hypothetical protein
MLIRDKLEKKSNEILISTATFFLILNWNHYTNWNHHIAQEMIQI